MYHYYKDDNMVIRSTDIFSNLQEITEEEYNNWFITVEQEEAEAANESAE